MNTENRLPIVSTKARKRTGGRGTSPLEFTRQRIVTVLRSLTAAYSTVELLRNGSLEF